MASELSFEDKVRVMEMFLSTQTPTEQAEHFVRMQDSHKGLYANLEDWQRVTRDAWNEIAELKARLKPAVEATNDN